MHRLLLVLVAGGSGGGGGGGGTSGFLSFVAATCPQYTLTSMGTCTDGCQNVLEDGIDCSMSLNGRCPLLCLGAKCYGQLNGPNVNCRSGWCSPDLGDGFGVCMCATNQPKGFGCRVTSKSQCQLPFARVDAMGALRCANTFTPTASPSKSPSRSPSKSPTTSKPSKSPSRAPSRSPTTSKPSRNPTTSKPSRTPTTSKPSRSPSRTPTTSKPTKSPSRAPTLPTNSPTWRPTSSPTTVWQGVAAAPDKSALVGFIFIVIGAVTGCCVYIAVHRYWFPKEKIQAELLPQDEEEEGEGEEAPPRTKSQTKRPSDTPSTTAKLVRTPASAVKRGGKAPTSAGKASRRVIAEEAEEDKVPADEDDDDFLSPPSQEEVAQVTKLTTKKKTTPPATPPPPPPPPPAAAVTKPVSKSATVHVDDEEDDETTGKDSSKLELEMV